MPLNQFIDDFFTRTKGSPIEKFHDVLESLITEFFRAVKHGHQEAWDDALIQLPCHQAEHFQLSSDCIEIGADSELVASIEPILRQFLPWRKGPFNFFGTIIDTEWRSDWKWRRLQPHIKAIKNRQVLDIGCGNGYHLMRMLGDGADLALGIDPTRLYLYQFHIARHFLPALPAYILPLRSEHLPAFNLFDTVFSLGVLYHRRSPIDHLVELLGFLRPGGELVLETLIVDGDEQTVLTPSDRYAKMANVWFLPSTTALENWLARAGFDNIRTVDINRTSTLEQRATDWMTFQSLNDFLDPKDSNVTVEGWPAPTRALLIAEKP